MEEKIVYFEKPGAENTDTVIHLVQDCVTKKGIKKIVLASTRGNAARAFAKAFEGKDIQLIVVPWQYSFAGEDEQPFPQSLVKELQMNGHIVHFGTMLFHTDELYGVKSPQLIANTLRIIAQGFKVCVEILMMATDGGCVKKGEKVIVVAGSSHGSDTAVVATAAPSNRMNLLRIHEILCKPL